MLLKKYVKHATMDFICNMMGQDVLLIQVEIRIVKNLSIKQNAQFVNLGII